MIYRVEDHVKDHCNYTGKCRGPVHSICDSKYSIPITKEIKNINENEQETTKTISYKL